MTRVGVAFLFVADLFRPTLLVVVTFFVATIVHSNATYAEDSGVKTAVATAVLPSDLPPIPGPVDTDAALYITKSNASLFHEVLLAPIASWFKDGLLMTRVVRNLAFNWQLSPEWESSSVSNVGRFDVDAQGGLLLVNEHPLAGFPFGHAEQINKDSDPIRRAYKILWNVTFAEAPSVDLLHEVELQWMTVKGVSRKAEGVFFRRILSNTASPVAPLTEAVSSKCADAMCATKGEGVANREFREELLHLKSPPVVLGFTMVGRRYFGDTDDDVWIHSPVTGRSRHVFSSNRSDPILGGVLTFDDFYVWAGKVQAFNARVVDEKTLLVPFPTLRIVEISRVRGGAVSSSSASSLNTTPGLPQAARPGWGGFFLIPELFTRRDSSATNMLWNSETAKFPQAAAWVPSAMSVVPRRVWILELSPRDPFYLSGRQILVVDQESMLPVYKVVYDRSGNYKKTVLGAWALASTADSKVRFPLAAFVLAVKADGQIAMSATSSAVETFLGKDVGRSGEVLSLFNLKDVEPKEGAKDPEKAGTSESGAPAVSKGSSTSRASGVSPETEAPSAVRDPEGKNIPDEEMPGLEVDENQPED